MKVLSQIGFGWHQNGAVVTVTVDGHTQQVFVPLHRLTLEFGGEMAKVGCPLLPAVGAEGYSVGGLFSRIKRAAKRGARAVKKTARKVTAPSRALARRVVPKAIRRAGTKIRRAATRYVKRKVVPYARKLKRFAHRSPIARYGAMAMTAFPATAPAGAALMAAQRTMDVVERGKRAARLVSRGLRRPQDLRAMALAQAQQRSVQQLGQLAQRGSPQAQQFMGALQQFAGRRW